MSLGAFTFAVRFLTRLPVPRAGALNADDLPRAAPWFPLVGAIVGAAVGAALWAGGHVSPSGRALCALLVWGGVTIPGGLPLDGLGDVADALAAAHSSPERFLAVLRDPHIGAFGVMAIALQLIAKLVLLADLSATDAVPALILVAAWARWGPLVWALVLPPLAAGSGERFAAQIDRRMVLGEGIALALLSLWLAPVLLAAPLVVAAVAVYWKLRLGGMTGDCLGAGIEVTETALLFLLVVAPV